MLWRIREVEELVTDYLIDAETEEEAWDRYYANEPLEVELRDGQVVHNEITLIKNDK